MVVSYPKKKVVLLKGKKRTELRYNTFLKANGQCEDCGAYAPFRVDDNFDVFSCGHMAHIIPRRRGGDIPENVRWLCYSCHIGHEHGPRWSKQNERDITPEFG